MDAIIISVGNELTLGETVDTNSAWLSQRLAEIGIHIQAHMTVADQIAPLQREIDRACDLAEVVLISGGLGPTEDDLTRQALAETMGVSLVRHEGSVEQIRSFFAARLRAMPEANLVQAMFPAGSTPIANTCGTAPGIRAIWKRATVFVMPGVPREMQVMFERDVQPILAPLARGAVILARTIHCFGAGESDIGTLIRDLMARGRNPTVGTTAKQAVIGVRIHAWGHTRAEAAALLEETALEVRRRLGSLIFGEDDETLWQAVGRLLLDKRRTIATAESCTGGLIAKVLTDVAGSSGYFRQGFVTYANESKTRLLDVPEDLILRHGAVCAPVAEAMAVGCRQTAGTDLALSVTGIAGPGGGTADKPVGLVYIGLADENGCQTWEHRLGAILTREEIRERTAKAALDHLRLRLMQPD